MIKTVISEEQSKIIIDFGSQRDGFVFRLDPLSQLWLEGNYPDRRRADSVFIGFDKQREVSQIHESVWDDISHLLTGFSISEINQLGGFVVRHPVTQQEVYNSLLIHA